MIQTGQRANAAQAAADKVSRAYMEMAMREKAINDGIRSGVLGQTANLGTTLSGAQQAMGSFNPGGTGFYDQNVLDALQQEYLAAAKRDADQEIARSASQLFSQDLRRGVASGTPGEDTQRRIMEASADVNRNANLNARQDAINEYKSLLDLATTGQDMEEGRRSYALDEIQGVLEPQIKHESGLLNTQTALGSMGNVDRSVTGASNVAATEAGNAASGFGSSLDDLLRERKAEKRNNWTSVASPPGTIAQSTKSS
ncbi:MAG: hypothetical protein P8R39_03880 [Alphaproteobacteria bacterium]|nr:hypothetical protein [Alphaproteobacteria bacterium]